MTSTLDLNLLPLAISGSLAQATLPGLHIAAPPRRPARGRHDDRLVLYLELIGNAPLPIDKHQQLLDILAQSYYKTPGAVTTALRAVAEELNKYLLERNLRAGSSGPHAAGLLTLTVLRAERLYLGLCGPTHAYLLTAEGLEHHFETESAGRGLGLSRSASIRFFQHELKPNDSLIITARPPAQWNEALLGSLYGQGPESIRRRLTSSAEGDLRAVLLQVKSGAGKNYLLQPRQGAAVSPGEAEELVVGGDSVIHTLPPRGDSAVPVQTEAIPLGPHTTTDAPSPTETEAPSPASTPEEVTAPPAGPAPQKQAEPGVSPARHARPGQATGMPTSSYVPAQPVAQPGEPAKPEARQPRARPGRRPAGSAILAGMDAIGRLWSGIVRFLAPIGRGARSLLGRMLPGENILAIPSGLMAFIAIAVPLVVVAVASVVYLRSGRASQYQLVYQQAVEAAASAQTQTDPMLARRAWEAALAYLDQAETFETTPDSQTLRNQAVQSLDSLEGIKRLDFQQAIRGGLPASFHVSRMAATDNEIFMLDAVTGRIGRAYASGVGFERDEAYQCGPGASGAGVLGPIVDFEALPKGNELNSTLLAMDENGNLLRCPPGGGNEPLSLTPPPTGMGKLEAFALDLNNFYALDPEKNAVWIYWRSRFTEEPELFFGDTVPPMQEVIDLAVDKNDLYLLHADGHITMCTYSELSVSPTRCADPLPYQDSRPGRENQPFVPPAPFTQILSTQPPDPSLYLLEPGSQSIYQFSLRLLTFHRHFQPLKRAGGLFAPQTAATAFALSPDNRVVFMAFGNEVYYANIP